MAIIIGSGRTRGPTSTRTAAARLRAEFNIVEIQIRLIGDAFIGVERAKPFSDWFIGFNRSEIGEEIGEEIAESSCVVLTSKTRGIGHRCAIVIDRIVTNDNRRHLTSGRLGPMWHFVFARWRSDIHYQRRRGRKVALGKSSSNIGTTRCLGYFVNGDDPNFFGIA